MIPAPETSNWLPLPSVDLTAGLSVSDVGSADLIRAVGELAKVAAQTDTLRVVTALHVGGLVNRAAPGFARALTEADIVCADGISVESLARLAGASGVERAATTDVGLPMLRSVSKNLGRPARVALIGGPPGLALDAAHQIEAQSDSIVVAAYDGFQDDWTSTCSALSEKSPDVLIVGMGSPRELLWVSEWRKQLPPCVVITCGGWFGFLTGTEKRAAPWMRRLGIEWMARLAQSPGRLIGRYSKGLFVTAGLAIRIVVANREGDRTNQDADFSAGTANGSIFESSADLGHS